MRLCLLLAVLATPGMRSEELRGTVVLRDESPAAGALVQVYAPAGGLLAETRTGADGSFVIVVETSRPVRLLAMGAGLASEVQELALQPAAPPRLRLELPLAQSEVTVTASLGLVQTAGVTEAMSAARSAEMFRTRPLPTLGQALDGVAGILLQQTGPSQVSPFLRGLTGYQVLNLVDGVRFNNSTFRSGPNQYLAFVEPSQAQRVEAALGPSSAQYGSDSLGGTIQVITHDARFADAAGLSVHGNWDVQAASADLSAGSAAHLALATPRLFWLVGAAGRRHGDLRAGGGKDSRHALRRYLGLTGAQIRALAGERQQDTAFAQMGWDSKFAARLGGNQNLSVWYQQSAQDGVRNYKDLWGGLGRLISDLAPQTLHFGYLRYEHLALGWLDSLSGRVSANAQGDGTRRQDLRAGDTVTTDDVQVNAFGYATQGAGRVRGHGFVFGAELYQERIGAARELLDPASGARRGARPLYPDGSHYRTAALFAQDRFEPWCGLRLTLGGRWTGAAYSTAADSFGTLAAVQRFGDWTFHTAAAWTARPWLEVYGLAGRGFRAPNANDLGAIGLNDLGYEIPAAEATPAGALLAASAAEGATALGRPLAPLRAERLLNYELGLRLRGGPVTARLQAFDAELYDPIVRRTLLFPRGAVPAALAGLTVTALPATPAQQAQGVVAVATTLDPRAVKAFVNDGRTRYTGVEARLEARLAAHWTAAASYAFLGGRELNPNRNVRRLSPQHGQVTLRHARGRFWWQSALTAAGAQRRLSGGDIDDERIGAARSRADIAAFFQGARLAPWVLQGVFAPTGEALRQIQDRLLPALADSTRAALYPATAGWLAWDVQAGISLTEWLRVNAGLFNVLDRNYRVHGSGADAAGRNVFLGLRLRF